MILPIRTTPTADVQILEIDLWWRQHRPKAPDLFEEELSLAFDNIAAVRGTGPDLGDLKP